MLKPHQTSCLLIDCQKAFLYAQGTVKSKAVAETIEKDIPILYRHGIGLHAAYSKANSVQNAGLLNNVHAYANIFRKPHESAFRSTGLADLLKKSFQRNVVLLGSHTTACVRLTAVDAINNGFRVFVASSHVAEGQRGRNLNPQEIESRERKTFDSLTKIGVTVEALPKLFSFIHE